MVCPLPFVLLGKFAIDATMSPSAAKSLGDSYKYYPDNGT